jgi:hypothetical protein
MDLEELVFRSVRHKGDGLAIGQTGQSQIHILYIKIDG